MTASDELGSELEIRYESETYLIELLSADRLRWTRIVGEGEGATDEESYVASRLDPERWLLTWVEASGLALSNAIDLSSATVTTHGSEGQDVFTNVGHYVRRE